jgi:hypothetical protein
MPAALHTTSGTDLLVSIGFRAESPAATRSGTTRPQPVETILAQVPSTRGTALAPAAFVFAAPSLPAPGCGHLPTPIAPSPTARPAGESRPSHDDQPVRLPIEEIPVMPAPGARPSPAADAGVTEDSPVPGILVTNVAPAGVAWGSPLMWRALGGFPAPLARR